MRPILVVLAIASLCCLGYVALCCLGAYKLWRDGRRRDRCIKRWTAKL